MNENQTKAEEHTAWHMSAVHTDRSDRNLGDYVTIINSYPGELIAIVCVNDPEQEANARKMFFSQALESRLRNLLAAFKSGDFGNTEVVDGADQILDALKVKRRCAECGDTEGDVDLATCDSCGALYCTKCGQYHMCEGC